ncbi:MAG: hypothetical protein ACK49H_17930 [Burkholderiales bacterium]|jgi:ubiquinone biosynthesis protein UbiJ
MRLVLAGLNHVLTQQVWARDRLRTHAGRIVRIVLEGPLGPLPLQCRITELGGLEPVQGTVAQGLSAQGPSTQVHPVQGMFDLGEVDPGEVELPAVTLTLRLSGNSLGALLSQGIEGLSGHLRIDGDVMVAAAVADVARHLRWDIEEDLSRVVGDAAAHRVVSMARTGLSAAQGMAERSLQTAVSHLKDDPQGIVERQQARALDDRLQRLESLVSSLEARARLSPTH